LFAYLTVNMARLVLAFLAPIATSAAYLQLEIFFDSQCTSTTNAAEYGAIGCVQSGPSSSYKITCLSTNAYTTTTYSASTTCTGASVDVNTTTLPCTPIGAGYLYELQTCHSDTYVSPPRGARITQYYNPTNQPGVCDATQTKVTEEVYPFLGTCVAGTSQGIPVSTMVLCNSTHATVYGYLGSSCQNPAFFVDPFKLGCTTSDGVNSQAVCLSSSGVAATAPVTAITFLVCALFSLISMRA